MLREVKIRKKLSNWIICDLKKHDADVFCTNFLHERGHMWHLEDNSRKRSSTFYGLYWYDCLTLRITVRFTITWQNKNILSYPCCILLLDFRYCISLIVQVAIIAACVLQIEMTSSITAQLFIAQRNISCEPCKT